MNDSKKKPTDAVADESGLVDEQLPSAAPSEPAQPVEVTDPATMLASDPSDLETEAAQAQTCAACGETDVFTEHSTIDETTLDYHSCPEAAALVHDYAVKSIRDRDYPKPVLAS